MVQIENLTKKYDDFLVLENINFEIKKGSIHCLVGENGTGKSTLIKIISGIIKGNTGKVTFENENCFENINVKSKIAYVNDDLYFDFSDTVNNLAKFYSKIYKTFDFQKLNELKKIVSINFDKKIFMMSKGMQKQAEICLALAKNCPLLILDEPFDGLDPVIRKKLWEFIMNEVYENNLTVLISTHNIKEIDSIADHITLIKNNHIVLNENIDDLKSKIFKVQLAFENENTIENLNILNENQIGRVKYLIIKNSKEEIISQIKPKNPLIFDFINLNLEDIFISISSLESE